MGTSKRYAAYYDEKMNEKIAERSLEQRKQIMEATPAALTKEEQELEVFPLTKPPTPTPVNA